MPLLGYIILNTLVCGILAALTIIFCWKLRKVDIPVVTSLTNAQKSEQSLPFVSILVPARNEEDKIGRCLQSLLAQDYPNFEVIVIDDCSTDNTLSIIETLAVKDVRVKIVNADEAPAGWLGKCSALVQGVRVAAGQCLIFTDADTFHKPQSVRLATSFLLTEKAELVSFMPVQELGSFWERVAMPALLGSFLIGDPWNKVNDLNDPRAYAYGQYFIVNRKTYEAVGGHGSVHDQILDDIVLGRVVKKNGFKIMAADGSPLYSVRMYTDLKSLWHGLVKNAYTIIDCNPFSLLGILLLINTTLLAPTLLIAYFIGFWLTGAQHEIPHFGLASALLALQIVLLSVWWHLSTQYYRGVNWLHMMLLPLGSIFVSSLYLESARRVYTGEKMRWKNREYSVSTDMSISAHRANEATLAPANVLDS
ncbi:MAG: glycosyltransferase [Candidatus Obscuribacterales bacterium]|nr:glycosyltransferase [Candidatus Obscuribacterales bacterium]